MPMLTTVVIRSPVCPRHCAGADPLGEARPSGPAPRARRRPRPGRPRPAAASRGSRSAVCSTARSSVALMCSPANMAAIRSVSRTRCGQGGEQPQRLVGDQVLAVVDVQVGDLAGEPLAPRPGRRRTAPAGGCRASASACLRRACHSSVVVTSTAIGSIFSFTTGLSAGRRRARCRRLHQPATRDGRARRDPTSPTPWNDFLDRSRATRLGTPVRHARHPETACRRGRPV